MEMGDMAGALESFKSASALNPADEECLSFMQSEFMS